MNITIEKKQIIFDTLKAQLEKLTPPLVANVGADPNYYELIGNTPVPYGSTKKIVAGMYFASIALRKNSVVFYFFPCYGNTALLENIPSLLKCLKGKTCFHFTRAEQINETELSALLQKGVAAWKKEGYVV